MGILGNQIAAGQALTIANDSFNGDGSTVAFTLSQTVGSVNDIEVLVDNVQQSPYDSSYSVSGTTLTFSGAPSAGTNNVYVIYNASRHIATSQVIPDDGSVHSSKIASNAVTDAKIAAVATSKLTGDIPYANMPVGSVIQVVNFVLPTATSISVGNIRQAVASGIKCSITPKSTNPLFHISACVEYTSSNFNVGYTLRDNTAGNFIMFNPGSTGEPGFGAAGTDQRMKITSGGYGSSGYLDGNDFGKDSRSVIGTYTPPDTNTREIEVWMITMNNSGTVYIGRNESNNNAGYDSYSYCSITLMEIAQ